MILNQVQNDRFRDDIRFFYRQSLLKFFE